ncbi:hypothetical protein B9Z55_020892 [Caenorhabditis nigoni]|uniref:Major facilitator superfamily (MFS) profile domain-containing protein n=1 Tax=Caenorhabditis nigoni TaxID=1611254 RepID=A0A2G5TPK1_9PELO|nr:hypothetical protein B9Z55_020892 [Caenorhabditis nigoni]
MQPENLELVEKGQKPQDENNDGNYSPQFSNKAIRAGFIRKVFGLVFIMTLVTSLFLMVISAHLRPNVNVLLLELVICIGCTLSIIVFALQTKLELTTRVAYIFIIFACFVMFGIVFFVWPMFFTIKLLTLIIALVAALFMMIYLFYGIQLVMGGKRYEEITPEDYIFAAVEIFLTAVLRIAENEKQTDWKSMWICIFLQFVVGVQISVYYMSMWPYLSGLDKTADFDFLGWVVAACSIGCTISNPLYGYWNQKTRSVKWPVITGFLIAAVGQAWYGLLGMFDNVKWMMLLARFLTGLGVGNITALRIYAAMASTPEDRMRAISFGTGGLILGFSFGPVISAVFTPLGEAGVRIGGFVLNMYTVVAYLMVLVCIFACVIIYFFFNESYVGLVTKEEQEKEDVEVPKFDMPAALICIYLFMIVNMTATNIEVMSSPLTTVLYDWKDSDLIFYNGIALAISSGISVSFNIAQGATRLGKIDKRKQMLFGLTFFLLYQAFMFPWGFYSGPLNFLPEGVETTEAGGCYAEYLWCNHTTRVPLPIYFFCFIVFFGVAFPFVETPSPALFSEILGPRKQGTMQGLFSVGGSLAPLIASITSTVIFKYYGYRYVIVLQASFLIFAILLILLFYKRLVPLEVIKKSNTDSTIVSETQN